jgi:RNA polymerase sigma factor (sigma-70 family)
VEDDSALFEAWRAGDRQAGKRLFERYYDPLYRFFRNKAGAEAVDLVQKTLLGCLENAHRYRGDGSFRSWLFGVAYRQLHTHYRNQMSARARFDLDAQTVSVFDLDPTPSRVLVERSEHRLLLEALRRIPLELQVALELHYWEQLSDVEIARALELPLGTAKSRIRRGRLLLAERLAEVAATSEELRGTLENLDQWAEELRKIALDDQIEKNSNNR